jgi:dipeptidyl aminopeptidase/acylaminoacyl peptidase
MELIRNRARAAVVLLLLMSAVHARADETPLAAFGRLPSLEDVVISPDGNNIAFVRTSGDVRNLVVSPITKHDILGGVHAGDFKLRSVTWVDDENVLVRASSTSLPPVGFSGPMQEWSQIANFNIKTLRLDPFYFNIRNELTFNTVYGNSVVRDVGGHPVLFSSGLCVHRPIVPCLFAFDYPDRHTRLVEEASDSIAAWLPDEAGNLVARLVYRGDTKTWQIRTHKNGEWTVAASDKAEIDIPRMLGFNADGTGVVVEFIVNGDPQWRTLNLADNTWTTPLGEGAAFVTVIAERKTGRIIGGIRETGSSDKVFFDNELQAHWNAALRAFPDERVVLESNSDDYSRMVLKVFGAQHGYVHALFDWYTHQATILGRVYEGVASPSEVRAISYAAADGLAIPGFLTLPRGKPEKNLPLIVFPHGGPESADNLEFNWWAQAMAAQGYAVLQPNFRGSSLGYKFMEAGFGEWGRKMQSDLSDGVRYLAKEGIIDPARVCVVGASYGGYAALAGVTLETGVYRCAVSVAGISDLKRFHTWTAASGGRSGRYWDRFLGISDKKDPALLAISPIEHLSALTVPVLLIHGRDDTVVPYEQSDAMLTAAKRAGKSIDLVTLKREDHWLSRSETRLQMLQATVDFLKANNPP